MTDLSRRRTLRFQDTGGRRETPSRSRRVRSENRDRPFKDNTFIAPPRVGDVIHHSGDDYVVQSACITSDGKIVMALSNEGRYLPAITWNSDKVVEKCSRQSLNYAYNNLIDKVESYDDEDGPF